MPRTKKVGATGRYGARHGKGVKKRIIAVEKKQKVRHKCPGCLKAGLKRLSPGIWTCHKCGLKVAGKAYEPGTK